MAASTAISAQGSKLYIATGTGGAKNITDVTVGYPTLLTSAAHTFTNGDVITLAGLTGADAALLNGQKAVVKYATTNTYAVDIDTTGKTITAGAGTATPALWTKVSNLKDFSGFDGSASDIDVTNLDSDAMEFRPGLVDNGSFTVNVDQDNADAGQLACRAAQIARTVEQFKLELPNADAATFEGYVKKFGTGGGVNAVVKSPVEIKITGAVIWS
jgi:Lambda phage tail tube protein, TTP